MKPILIIYEPSQNISCSSYKTVAEVQKEWSFIESIKNRFSSDYELIFTENNTDRFDFKFLTPNSLSDELLEELKEITSKK